MEFYSIISATLCRDQEVTSLNTWSNNDRSVSAIAQTHGAQTLAPDLLDMFNGLNKVRHERLRVLSRWKVTKTWHGLVLSARDLVCSLLRQLRRV
jgi:hypothetical protein